ncbi:MAG: PocR ligand-binding domain-containing protein, partial [Candidatus Omnitrophota bacterium]
MGLFDIVERDKWRMMQEGFSRTLGICMQTVDPEGKPFPGVNSISQTHLDIINILPFEKGVRQLVDNVKKNKADNYYEFPAGLYLYAIPIEIRDEGALGHILMGPALLQKKVSAGDGFADKAAG